MNNKLWRVDNELLTIVEMDRSSLREDTPLNYWLPVMYGEGEYIYLEDENTARITFKNILNEKIVALQGLKRENGFE